MPNLRYANYRNRPRTAKGYAAVEVIEEMGATESMAWFNAEMGRRGHKIHESYFTELYKCVHGFSYSTDEALRRRNMEAKVANGKPLMVKANPLPGEPDEDDTDIDDEPVDVRRDKADELSSFMRLAVCVQAVGGVAVARKLIDEMERIHELLGGAGR